MKLKTIRQYRILLISLGIAILASFANAVWTVSKLKLPKLDEDICVVQFLKITEKYLLATANTQSEYYWGIYLLKYDLSEPEKMPTATKIKDPWQDDDCRDCLLYSTPNTIDENGKGCFYLGYEQIDEGPYLCHLDNQCKVKIDKKILNKSRYGTTITLPTGILVYRFNYDYKNFTYSLDWHRNGKLSNHSCKKQIETHLRSSENGLHTASCDKEKKKVCFFEFGEKDTNDIELPDKENKYQFHWIANSGNQFLVEKKSENMENATYYLYAEEKYHQIVAPFKEGSHFYQFIADDKKSRLNVPHISSGKHFLTIDKNKNIWQLNTKTKKFELICKLPDFEELLKTEIGGFIQCKWSNDDLLHMLINRHYYNPYEKTWTKITDCNLHPDQLPYIDDHDFYSQAQFSLLNGVPCIVAMDADKKHINILKYQAEKIEQNNN